MTSIEASPPVANPPAPDVGASLGGEGRVQSPERGSAVFTRQCLATQPSPDVDAIARERADWLVDAVATSTQNRMFLRGEPEADEVAIDAIYLNGEKAIRIAIERAFTAHTASLREKVEELEADVTGMTTMFQATSDAYGVEVRRADAAEADANRMREALDLAVSWTALVSGDDIAARLRMALNAGYSDALSPRPADEPVTLGER